MPVCKTCSVEKDVTEFHKNDQCVGGHRAVCKRCVAAKGKAYREANRDKVLARKKDYAERNRDKVRASNARYYAENKEKHAAGQRSWYERNKESVKARVKAWTEANPEKARANKRKNKLARKDTVKAEYERNKADYFARAAARRGVVKQATPAWADKDQIAEMYIIAAKLNSFFTKPVVHVDHVVPLNGATVCGLHTPDNLQILSLQANLRKGNRHWPDMP